MHSVDLPPNAGGQPQRTGEGFCTTITVFISTMTGGSTLLAQQPQARTIAQLKRIIEVESSLGVLAATQHLFCTSLEKVSMMDHDHILDAP